MVGAWGVEDRIARRGREAERRAGKAVGARDEAAALEGLPCVTTVLGMTWGIGAVVPFPC